MSTVETEYEGQLGKLKLGYAKTDAKDRFIAPILEQP
jgi:hypothetical protein